MDEVPVVITEQDVKDSNLLLRALRKMLGRIADLSRRVVRVEQIPIPPTLEQIRQALQASGSHPLNTTGLLGVQAQPQPASVSLFTTAPTGQVLQSLRDGQLVYVTSPTPTLYRVVGGNPTTLTPITVTGSLPANVAYTDVTNLFTLNQEFGAQFTKYNNVSTVGAGVAPILGRVAQVTKTASIGTTTIYTPPTAGEYRVAYYLFTEVAGAGNVSVAISWTDDIGGKSQAPAAMNLTAGTFQANTYYIRAGTAAISYTTTYAATGTYALYITLERLN